MPVNVKRLSRTALLIGGATILKTAPPARGVLRRLYRGIVGGSLPFQNEALCYRVNPEAFPDIEIVDGAKVILIRFEEPTGTAIPADVTPRLVLHLGAQIGALRGHTGFGPAKRALFRLLNGPVPRSLRDLARSSAFSPRVKLRLAARLVSLHLRQPRIPGAGRMVHNDLMLHNILRFGDGFRVIDFEDSLVEHKWVFADLTDLMFQAENWVLEQVLDTLRQMTAELRVPVGEAALQTHFAFGFLRYHIRATVMTRQDAGKKDDAARRVKEWLDDAN